MDECRIDRAARRRRTLAACVFLCCALAGCGLVRRPPATRSPLATTLQTFAPHADRDHFVYVWERFINGRRIGRGIQVEHVTALPAAGEFEVALSENGILSGRLRVRDDQHALLLLDEEDVGAGLRVTYDPPLPQLAVPLHAGEQRANATATLTLLSDGEAITAAPVTQVVRASAAPDVRWFGGPARRAIMVRTTRTLQLPEGPRELSSDMLLVEGIGEVRSQGTASDMPVLRRQLACAFIGGRPLGDCSKLNEVWEEPNGAGSSDVQ